MRHDLRVANVVEEAPGVVSIYVTGRDLERLPVASGQYFLWRFLSRHGWWRAHPFSISAAPNGQYLRTTVKALGDWSAQLQDLRIGTRVRRGPVRHPDQRPTQQARRPDGRRRRASRRFAPVRTPVAGQEFDGHSSGAERARPRLPGRARHAGQPPRCHRPLSPRPSSPPRTARSARAGRQLSPPLQMSPSVTSTCAARLR
jgi:hypothetical protein